MTKKELPADLTHLCVPWSKTLLLFPYVPLVGSAFLLLNSIIAQLASSESARQLCSLKLSRHQSAHLQYRVAKDTSSFRKPKITLDRRARLA